MFTSRLAALTAAVVLTHRGHTVTVVDAQAEGANTSRAAVVHARTLEVLAPYGVAAMLEAQGGLCALCRERPAQHVDHDHLTGKVRAMLCFCCNQALGNLRDRADIARAAAAYLEIHSWQKRRLEAGVYAVIPPAERDEGRTAQP